MGRARVRGAWSLSGRRLRLWFKNENHVSWLDGDPFVTGPDMIEIVDPKTGEPLVNSFLAEGQEVAVIGIKRCPQFDTPRASMPRAGALGLRFALPADRDLGGTPRLR